MKFVRSYRQSVLPDSSYVFLFAIKMSASRNYCTATGVSTIEHDPVMDNTSSLKYIYALDKVVDVSSSSCQ